MSLTSALIHLYPAAWRERYGEEFAVLLEERPVGPFDVADVVLGALDARLRFRSHAAESQHRSLPMTLRIGGVAAIAGAGLLTLAGLSSLGIAGEVGQLGTPILFIVGLFSLLVALAGMSAFQARAHPVLSWAAFLVPALGTVASVAGMIGTSLVGESGWGVWFVGTLTALAGSALFALVTWRTAALSRWASLLLGFGSILPFAGFVSPSSSVLPMASIVCFLLGWFLLGVHAIRLDRPGIVPRPA